MKIINPFRYDLRAHSIKFTFVGKRDYLYSQTIADINNMTTIQKHKFFKQQIIKQLGYSYLKSKEVFYSFHKTNNNPNSDIYTYGYKVREMLDEDN